MGSFLLMLVVICGCILYALAKIGAESCKAEMREEAEAKREKTSQQSYSSKDWFEAGGMLGLAILIARLTRMPLASILTSMPFLLQKMSHAEHAQTSVPPASSAMTRAEAALILGLSQSASEGDIREAHRRLMTKNHPDVGGSDYLAAKINQARDVLLG